MKAFGLFAAVALIAGAAFVGSSPWRVHGGRFVTEYLIAAGVIGIPGLIVLALSLR